MSLIIKLLITFSLVVFLLIALCYLIILILRIRGKASSESIIDNSRVFTQIAKHTRDIEIIKASILEIRKSISLLRKDKDMNIDDPVNIHIHEPQDGQSDSQEQSTESSADREPEEINNDGRIWVQKTKDGIKKLEVSQIPSFLYLISEEGDLFSLHIENFKKLNINEIMRLYGEIIEHPIGFSRVNSIKITYYPQYIKQGDYYLFVDKGKLTID